MQLPALGWQLVRAPTSLRPGRCARSRSEPLASPPEHFGTRTPTGARSEPVGAGGAFRASELPEPTGTARHRSEPPGLSGHPRICSEMLGFGA